MFQLTPSDFSEIEQLHAEWSEMDNIAKFTWLSKEKIRLNRLANQMAQYVSANGGFMNNAQRANARKLLEMLNSVDADGARVINDLRSDAFKELAKGVLTHI